MTTAPWMKFYPADWRSDPALRTCSLAARGLWMEMLALMHEAEPRGYLLVSGLPITERQLSGLSGASLKETLGLLKVLEERGVFSRDERGVIYSRRMVRDEEKTLRDRENGRLGGNPKITKGVNPQDKAQKLEARSQKPEAMKRGDNGQPDVDSGGGSGADVLVALRARICRLFEARGVRQSPDTAHAGVWLARGYDPEIIAAVVESKLANNGNVGSLNYFDRAIAEAHEAPKRRPRPSSVEPVRKPPRDPARDRIGQLFKARAFFAGEWQDGWVGPKPGEAGFPEDVAAEAARERGVAWPPADMAA